MRCAVCVLLIAGAGILGLAGACRRSTSAESRFAPGAFPPVLSDEEYHRRPWQRTDCLTCHETGVNDAPKMKHHSLPDLAKGVKCRSCHVLQPGRKATER